MGDVSIISGTLSSVCREPFPTSITLWILKSVSNSITWLVVCMAFYSNIHFRFVSILPALVGLTYCAWGVRTHIAIGNPL
ncbi:Hypothetical protein DEACI_4086 [Acididesulfobacillus acetoxydans]|uniref:Uncharacterized protein n=1 Tax=Acididesulfobacillus acetoxydans TaxID=1561005 RepID=A0A8S0VYP9_9FIRM|nr:Hypothetical protein DEACI_4086 [Acididesulfobacillus acetoxydans]CEJ07236.1 Hypothetical protein DEACI_1695 [Acididesulfobacillus acetoxydans]